MYTQLAEIPVPTSAQFIASDVVEVSYSVRDHVRNVKRTLSKIIDLSSKAPKGTPLQDVSEVIGSVTSPSMKLRAILREVKSDSQSKRYVEIWVGSRLETSVDVTDRHGAFYADEYFTSLSFSASETSIVYTAEGKQEPTSEDPYARFRFKPDLGEGLAGKKRPTLFIFRWDSSAPDIKAVNKLYSLKAPDSVLFGQAVFSPSKGDVLYATGYEYASDGRLLGVKGCFNRPCGIWQLQFSLPQKEEILVDLEPTLYKITPSHLSCRSPRVVAHDDAYSVFWLSCASGGAHIASSSLYRLDITPTTENNLGMDAFGRANCIIDPFSAPRIGEIPGTFPAYNLPTSPIIRDVAGLSKPGILFHSMNRSRTDVVLAFWDSGSKYIDAETQLESVAVLATDGRSRFISQRSTPSVPYEISLGEFNSNGEVAWRNIDVPDLSYEVTKALSGLRTSILKIPDRHPAETILIQPPAPSTEGEIPPCVTIPHGGPHGTTTTAFSASTTALVLEGYTVSLPNYTGSPGFGEGAIQALVGQCGTLDVQDCIASVHHLIDLGISQRGPGKQFVMGGSHGGFLTAHLIGQFPDVFSAAVLRNPVISSGEISTSDIPDWYYSEFGLPYSILSSTPGPLHSDSVTRPRPPLMSDSTFSTLQAASPITYVESVCIPVLLLIGAADLRVAPTQGMGYYYALKGLRAEEKGTAKVEMLIFEGESHPLDGVEAARVGFEAGRDLFAEFRK